MTPSTSKLLQSMQFTLETELMPNIEGDYPKSLALTMVNLFRYSTELVENEGQMLWDENKQLQILLDKVSVYLDKLELTEEGQRVVAKLSLDIIEPENSYPSTEYLNRVSCELNQRLDDTLSLLTKFPKKQKEDRNYQQLREDIRSFLVDNINREDDLMIRSFTSKRR